MCIKTWMAASILGWQHFKIHSCDSYQAISTNPASSTSGAASCGRQTAPLVSNSCVKRLLLNIVYSYYNTWLAQKSNLHIQWRVWRHVWWWKLICLPPRFSSFYGTKSQLILCFGKLNFSIYVFKINTGINTSIGYACFFNVKYL